MAARITGKQRAARKRNIKVAQAAKKKLPKSRRYKVVGGQTSLGGKLPKRKGKLTKGQKKTVGKSYKSSLEMGIKRKHAVNYALLKVGKLSRKTARSRRVKVRVTGY